MQAAIKLCPFSAQHNRSLMSQMCLRLQALQDSLAGTTQDVWLCLQFGHPLCSLQIQRHVQELRAWMM